MKLNKKTYNISYDLMYQLLDLKKRMNITSSPSTNHYVRELDIIIDTIIWNNEK